MSEAIRVDEGLVRSIIPGRRRSSRKGENGVVLVVGGSWLYHGAPFLVSMAAYRSGVDLVYVAVPEPIAAPIRALNPALIVIPLPDSKLTLGSVSKLLKVLPSIDAAAIGPGLSLAKESALIELVGELLRRGAGVVLDATALIPEVLPVLRGKRVIMTPHAGEFKRLFGEQPSEVLEDRVELARKKAAEHEVTILLKGPVDVISDGEEVYVNEAGNPAMTVGGSGDVLTGITAGLLSRGIEPLRCAAASAFINGRAGEQAAAELGLHLLPMDIIERIPKAMKPFDSITD